MSSDDKERKENEKILILCVDRDNDIGKKVGIKTPLIGRDRNIDAAIKLILNDPEEADANAMFEAIRIYDNMKGSSSNEEYEIATIAGLEIGGVSADRKVVSELVEVLGKFKANSIILVTDGFSDEDILPLIQSRVPVTSIRRVIVKHSETIEQTAAVFWKYLRMLVEDPRYSRIFLGLPGIILLLLGFLLTINLSYPQIFYPFGLSTYALILSMLVVGSFLLVKGYGLDKKIVGFYRWLSQIYLYTLPRLLSGFSLITGLLLIGIGFFQAWTYVAGEVIPHPPPSDISMWIKSLPTILGYFISKSLTLFITGVCIVLGGRSLRHLFDRDPRFWRTLAFTIVLIWFWEILNEASLILINPSLSSERLIAAIIGGIIITVISGFGTHMLSKRYEKFFSPQRTIKS